MTTQQPGPVAIAAAEMATAEGALGEVIELIVVAAMIGTKWSRCKIFVSAVIAKARRQLPRILPIDSNDYAAIAPACGSYPSHARRLRRKQKQTERRREAPH